MSDLIDRSVVTVPDGLDQEEVAKLFRSHRYAALPVVDAGGALCGVVTADDIIGVVEREATEGTHKLGGVGGALAAPYLRVGLWAVRSPMTRGDPSMAAPPRGSCSPKTTTPCARWSPARFRWGRPTRASRADVTAPSPSASI